MLIEKYRDGSYTELYQDGDLVELAESHNVGIGAEAGEWGRVVLNREDREIGHASCISSLTIKTAGVSTPKESFQQCISDVKAYKVKAIPEQMKRALIEAVSYDNCNGMTPCVYRVRLNGEFNYGFNFQPLQSKVHDRFHYDHGVGTVKNEDAEIVWTKASTQ